MIGSSICEHPGRHAVILMLTVTSLLASPAPVTGQLLPPERNLRIPVCGTCADRDAIVFSVAEAQAGEDLNGDGDLDDAVAHVFWSTIQTVRNYGVAMAAECEDFSASELAANTRAVVFHASEAAEGRDLNGDGDILDRVAHVADRAAAEPLNLGITAVAELISTESLVVIVAGESAGDSDLNADGDLEDVVIHVLDTEALELKNLGFAVTRGSTEANVEAEGGLVAFYADESMQGSVDGDGTDLNGDGDTDDGVLHIWSQETGETTNLRLATDRGGPRPAVEVTGTRVIVAVSESAQGSGSGVGTDLNGDGDTGDLVIHVVDARSGEPVNLGLAVSPGPDSVEATESRVHVAVSEADQGEADLNGDGDTADAIVHAVDLDSRQMRNLGVALATPETHEEIFDAEGNLAVVVIDEAGQGGTDLNGDGDTVDAVVHVVRGDGPEIQNLGVAVGPGQALELAAGSGAVLGILVSESDQGGTDLNGDGDIDDQVIHVWTAGSPGVENLHLAALEGFGVEERFVAFRVDEAAQGADLDGDGVETSRVLHVHEPSTGFLMNSRLAAAHMSTGGDLLAFGVDETIAGDLDDDGEASDVVLHVWEHFRGVIDYGFKRGDVDGNGLLEITDAVNNVDFQFLGVYRPGCLDALDFDDNGALEITDPIGNLGHQFLGYPPPPAPGANDCGHDPTPDREELDCREYPPESCFR